MLDRRQAFGNHASKTSFRGALEQQWRQSSIDATQKSQSYTLLTIINGVLQLTVIYR